MAEHPVVDAPRDLAPWIDHTVLAADATEEKVETCCREALDHGFRAVCVNPVHVARVARALRGSAVRACSVASFPPSLPSFSRRTNEMSWPASAARLIL